jgi:Na+/proline symporter
VTEEWEDAQFYKFTVLNGEIRNAHSFQQETQGIWEILLITIIIIIIIILLQMGFSPVAVVQKVHNRQFNTNYTK